MPKIYPYAEENRNVGGTAEIFRPSIVMLCRDFFVCTEAFPRLRAERLASSPAGEVKQGAGEGSFPIFYSTEFVSALHPQILLCAKSSAEMRKFYER